MSDDVFTQTEGVSESALEQLVGQGKKFETIEDLAKGKLEADAFIQRLEGENQLTREQMAELEVKAQKQHTVSELIDAVKKTNEQGVKEGNQPISKDDLSNMVKSIMDGEHETQTRAQNRRQANQSVLDKVNGDVEAARSYVAERAKALNTTVEKLQALGEDSPTAFRTLMETNPSTGSQSITHLQGTGIGSVDGQPETVVDGHKTKAYYDNLKKEMGASVYWNDSKIQGQYYKDAVALGDRFNK
jgi:hypothetical protein